jgi:hypothetical protein
MKGLELPPRFETVTQVAAGLDSLDGQLRAARDLRGLFVMAYIATTGTIKAWIERGLFRDNAAMSRYVVAFANEYRNALVLDLAGERERIPRAWRQSFEACSERRASIFQCLMLGINAHINRDLPYAVVASCADLSCDSAYDDYRRINQVLRLNMPIVRERIAETYGDPLPGSCRWARGLVEVTLFHKFRLDRRQVWRHARLLASADGAVARTRVDEIIERHAELAGAAIMRRGDYFSNGLKSLTAAQRFAEAAVGF